MVPKTSIGVASSLRLDPSARDADTTQSAINNAIAILGVPFDNVTATQAVSRIEQMVATRRPHYCVTANVDFLAQARADVELRRILFDAHLVLCDGTPLVWASRLLGNALPERVAGSDLVPQLIRRAAEKNLRLFFLGGTPETMERAMAKLKTEFPGLAITGYSPPFNRLLEMDHEDIKTRIAGAQPDLLFVSFGCPKQEKWISMHHQSLGVPVAIGVGGTIDFLAGQLKRAPRWMQRTGTEWIFRLLQEPRRLFGRYVRDLRVFAWAIIAQWWTMHFRHSKAGNYFVPPKPLPNSDGHCLLPMSQADFLGSAGMAWLMRLQREFHAAGRQLILLDPHPAVKRALSFMRLEDFFTIAPDVASARELLESRILEERELIEETADENPLSLGWHGEITAANAEPVWQQTEKRLAGNGNAAQQWVIDLSQVRFIDSAALGVMVRARKFAHHQGCELSFTGAQPAVRNVLRLARLETLLSVKDN